MIIGILKTTFNLKKHKRFILLYKSLLSLYLFFYIAKIHLTFITDIHSSYLFIGKLTSTLKEYQT